MRKNILLITLVFIIFLFSGPLYLLFSGNIITGQRWYKASREPANLIEIKQVGDRAAVILFSAPAFDWRGMFSTHTWLAVKTYNQTEYTIYQVIGWNQYNNKPIVDVSYGVPDRLWYGASPKIEAMVIGDRAQANIAAIESAVQRYPYAKTYHAWPGPNSNTFVAYILKQVPKLNFMMPYNALGRDYGWQWSINHLKLGGIIGYSFSTRATVINFFGLTFGVSFKPYGFIIPGVGLIKIL